MISLRSVGYAYQTMEGPSWALHDVSLHVERGERVCLVGANGSGKSTVARLCDGLFLPTEGAVEVDGLDTSLDEYTWDVRSRVGLVLQDPDDQIVGTSVEEDAAFGPENLGVRPDEIRQRVAEALEIVGLAGLERREPHLLSEGQKQRLAIAGALAMRPAYLVLDEPTSMLDPEGRADVMRVVERLVSDEGTGVLHISHRLEEVARADRCVALSAGEVVFEGVPADLLGDEELLASCNLATPAVFRLADALRRRGIEVPPTALDAAAIIEGLPC